LKKLLLLIFVSVVVISCDKSSNNQDNSNNRIVICSGLITSSFTGNGVQWGGYDNIMEWTGNETLSEEDWNTLFSRVKFLRPSVVRIMVSDGWNYLINGSFDPSKSQGVLIRILDFCQENNIKVILGEWGHEGGSSIDSTWLNNSTSFLTWLLTQKKYTCITWINIVNEPNGSWSSINNNFELWTSLINQYYSKLEEKGVTQLVKLTGPDIAIWNTASTYWISDTYSTIGKFIEAYDIHTYPTETEVRTGDYIKMVKAYKAKAPVGKEMLMTEFGFKYDSSSELGLENESLKDADKYTSDDSNMMIYKSFYGIDVADAIIQNMLAGYSGVILWDMDDAMYNIDGGASTLLKRWGFWNILGKEKFEKSEDESIRPWFFTSSLMCRYFPSGTAIFQMSLPAKKGLRAVAGVLNGKYTIAIVNSNYVAYTLTLAMEKSLRIESVKAYKYVAGDGVSFTGAVDSNGFATPYESNIELDFSSGKEINIDLDPQSFILFTNMN
jgi:hypothetical protein